MVCSWPKATSSSSVPWTPVALQSSTALFGIIGIGVAFVIVTGGIDLSIGSVVCLVGCGLPWLLTTHHWSLPAALLTVAAVSLGIGLMHGLLITKLKIQPFVVTLCGLLLYRGIARGFTNDQTVGFGAEFKSLRTLATGQAGSSTVRYTFFDVNHRNDSANFTLHILATNVVGIKNIAAKSKNKISTAFPNPSINNTSITYSIENPKNTLLVLYDVLGKEVWSKKPESTEGIFQLNTSSLQAGIYFYSLLVDNVSIVTKKLIVTEK